MSAPRFTVGWVYNLENVPESTQAGRVIALALTLSLAACFFVALRLGIRWKTIHTIGYDDWAIASSAILGIGYSVGTVYQTRWGLGLDKEHFPEANILRYSLIQYTGGPQYCLAILGFKVSLLASYLRVAGFNRSYAMALYVCMGLVTVSQLIFTGLHIASCSPIAKQWDSSVEGKCIDALPMYFALGGTSLAWDVLIIVMPFPILRRLQLDTRSKVALALLFALGFFVTIIQVIRIQTIAALATYTDSQPVIEWSIVEINLGVITACIPTFRPFLRNLGRKIASSNGGTKLTSFARRSKSNNKTNRLSESRPPKYPAKGDFSREPREEDEVELWDGYNRQPGQQRPRSVHVKGECPLRECPLALEANDGKDEAQITIRHDISVEYGSNDTDSR